MLDSSVDALGLALFLPSKVLATSATIRFLLPPLKPFELAGDLDGGLVVVFGEDLGVARLEAIDFAEGGDEETEVGLAAAAGRLQWLTCTTDRTAKGQRRTRWPRPSLLGRRKFRRSVGGLCLGSRKLLIPRWMIRRNAGG